MDPLDAKAQCRFGLALLKKNELDQGQAEPALRPNLSSILPRAIWVRPFCIRACRLGRSSIFGAPWM